MDLTNINSNTLPWIEAGYEIFANQGPDALKIEQLARVVGKSKSSFYHHFADLPVFHENLMEWHLQRALELAEKAKQCKSMIPDMLMVFAENKQDLLFNRQLRIHRTNYTYQLCFQRAHSVVQNEFLHLWAEMLDLQDQKHIAQNILDIVTDIFYQRITNENLTYGWLVSFIEEIKVFLNDVIKSSGVASQLK